MTDDDEVREKVWFHHGFFNLPLWEKLPDFTMLLVIRLVYVCDDHWQVVLGTEQKARLYSHFGPRAQAQISRQDMEQMLDALESGGVLTYERDQVFQLRTLEGWVLLEDPGE